MLRLFDLRGEALSDPDQRYRREESLTLIDAQVDSSQVGAAPPRGEDP